MHRDWYRKKGPLQKVGNWRKNNKEGHFFDSSANFLSKWTISWSPQKTKVCDGNLCCLFGLERSQGVINFGCLCENQSKFVNVDKQTVSSQRRLINNWSKLGVTLKKRWYLKSSSFSIFPPLFIIGAGWA